MHDTVTRHKSMIFNADVPGEKCPSSNDCVAADVTIMRGVGVMHEVIVISDYRRTPFHRAAVNLTVFTENVAVTDLEKSLSTRVREILRLMADDSTHVNDVVFANFAPPCQHGVSEYACPTTNLYDPIDDYIRANV